MMGVYLTRCWSHQGPDEDGLLTAEGSGCRQPPVQGVVCLRAGCRADCTLSSRRTLTAAMGSRRCGPLGGEPRPESARTCACPLLQDQAAWLVLHELMQPCLFTCLALLTQVTLVAVLGALLGGAVFGIANVVHTARRAQRERNAQGAAAIDLKVGPDSFEF